MVSAADDPQDFRVATSDRALSQRSGPRVRPSTPRSACAISSTLADALTGPVGRATEMAKDAIEVARPVCGFSARPNGEPSAARKSPSGTSSATGSTARTTSVGNVKYVDAVSDIPAVNDIVDEVESDCHRARNRRVGTEFGQCECRFEHSLYVERIEQIGRCRSVRADRVGVHRIGDSSRLPYFEVGTVSSGRRGKSVVLHGHMRKQVSEAPSGARRRPSEVVDGHRCDDIDGRFHGAAVQRA